VCSGIAAYFGIDAVWIRIGFIILTLFWGTGLILYIILGIIIPEAKTTTEKMEMRGQPITIAGIVDTMKQEFTDEKNKKRVEKFKTMASDTGESMRKVFSEKSSGVGSVIKRIIRFPFEVIIAILKFLKNIIIPLLLRIIGVFILLGTIIGLFALTSGLFALIFNVNSPYVTFPIRDLITGPLYYFSLIFGYLIFFIPLILIALLALTMVRYKNSFPKAFTLSLISAWIIIGVFGGAIIVSNLPEIIAKGQQHPFFKETTTTYPLKNFTKLSINGPYDVVVKQGKEFSVKISSKEYAMRYINVEQKNTTLIINRIMETKPCIGWCDTPYARIEITMPDLQEISNRTLNDEQTLHASGRGTSFITLENMNLNNLKLDLLHHYISLKNTKIKNLDATIIYSSIRGNGQIKNVKLFSDSSEWGEDNELSADTIQADLRNHSYALFTTKQLTITASEESQIFFTGNPKITSNIDKTVLLAPYEDYRKNPTKWRRSEEGYYIDDLNLPEEISEPEPAQE
jgi:phage shock protein PspC (stress-responsive transcriptional regulator)